MDISEKVDYWLDIADYDMETARSLFYIEGRYPAYKKKLSAMINKEKGSSILKRTEELNG